MRDPYYYGGWDSVAKIAVGAIIASLLFFFGLRSVLLFIAIGRFR